MDAGTTDDGLPYLVMNYVEGEPISQFAQVRDLSINDRLGLFRSVCAAVTYAHQNLVVHRDLKPSNILITKDGQIRLLDFGIAKLLEPDGEGRAVTITMLRVMTPEYASPEQIRGDSLTTVSDVYSLGVVLYELLTGKRPYKLTRKTPEELSRAICERDPQRPSTTVAKGDGNAKFENRNSKILKGDLDNIVLKAFAEGTVAAIRLGYRTIGGSWLATWTGLPVRARKDTLSYRTGKFIERHKLTVGAAVLLFARPPWWESSQQAGKRVGPVWPRRKRRLALKFFASRRGP